MQVAEITRDETTQRAALLGVRSYDVELDLTGGPETFRSTSVIAFDCAQPGAASYADLVAGRIHEITLNGVPLDPAAVYARGRIALTGLAARNELRVVADCAYASDGSGLIRSQDSADGRVYLSTQFEVAGARKVFTCFEQPDLKAEFTFHVGVPGSWIVLSNQPAPQPEPAGDGRAVWHFPATPRISTYLTAVVAGEYYLVADSHTTPSGQVIPLSLACRRSLAEFLEPDEMFSITRAGLDYYTGLFGMDYPFAKYDQVFVTDSAGAMENPGCVTISEQMLFRSKVTDTMRELRAEIVLHEMAHMWFGDLVTMKWWDDLWLNESFAEMCASQSSAEATRFADAWTTFCGGRKTWGYTQDQQPSTHPIAADAPTLSVAEANFDGISYAKGASVLKQLVAYLGRDNFFAGIRAYLAGHAWATPLWPTCCGRWRQAPARPWASGRRAGCRPRGRTHCGASSRPTTQATSPSSRCGRRRRPSTRRSGRTTSRSDCTTGTATARWCARIGSRPGWPECGRRCRTSSACRGQTCCCSTMTISATRSSGSMSARWPPWPPPSEPSAMGWRGPSAGAR